MLSDIEQIIKEIDIELERLNHSISDSRERELGQEDYFLDEIKLLKYRKLQLIKELDTDNSGEFFSKIEKEIKLIDAEISRNEVHRETSKKEFEVEREELLEIQHKLIDQLEDANRQKADYLYDQVTKNHINDRLKSYVTFFSESTNSILTSLYLLVIYEQSPNTKPSALRDVLSFLIRDESSSLALFQPFQSQRTKQQLDKFSDKYISELANLSAEKLSDLYEILREVLDYYSLKETFEILLNLISDEIASHIDGWYQEVETSELSLELEFGKQFRNLCDGYPNGKLRIINIYAKLNGYCLYLDEKHEITSICDTKETFIISALRLVSHGKNNVNLFYNSKPLNELNGKYDLLLADVPELRARYDGEFEFLENFQDGKDSRGFDFFFEKIFLSLTDKGNAVIKSTSYNIHGHDSFCHSNKRVNKSLRKNLILDGKVDSIISFGGFDYRFGSYAYVENVLEPIYNSKSSISEQIIDTQPFVLLFLSNYEKKDEVLLLHINNDKQLTPTLFNDIFNKNYSGTCTNTIVSKDNFKSKNWSFRTGVYFFQNYVIDGLPLKKILKPAKTIETKKGLKAFILRQMDGFMGSTDKLEECVLTDGHSKDSKLFDSPLLIIRMEYWSMQPYVRYADEDTPILIPDSNEYMLFEVNDNLIDPRFFTTRDFVDIIDRQTHYLIMGNNETIMPQREFLQLRIPENYLLKNSFSKGHKIQSGKLSENKKDHLNDTSKKISENSITNDILTQILSLNHNTGTNFQNLSSSNKTLLKFFESHSQTEEFRILNEKFNLMVKGGSIIENLERIRHENTALNDYISRTDEIMNFYRREKKPISLYEINNEISLKASSYIDHFQITFEKKNDRKNQGLYIDGNMYLLGILFTVLFDNARDHAFDGVKKDERKVFIKTEVVDGFLQLVYSDNGNGFKKDFGKNDFIEHGKSRVSKGKRGLGGAQLNTVATYHGNEDWKFNPTHEEYSVEFIFSFKIIE